MNRAIIIYNPHSGRQNQQNLAMITTIARRLGWHGKVETTSLKKPVQSIVQKYLQQGTSHFVVCGGDGTVRAALSQLVHQKVSVGIVPLGTGNILAKNLNIPFDLESALKIAFAGHVRHIDIGQANSHPFVLIAGVGIDVDAMSANQTSKSSFGIFAYILEALKNIFKRSPRYLLKIDQNFTKKIRAKSILVANIGTTDGGINLVPGASPQSGDFKIAIIKAPNLFSWLVLVFNALRGRINQSPNYRLLEGHEVEIIPLSSIHHFECDGDVYEFKDKLKLAIQPRAVTVLVP